MKTIYVLLLVLSATQRATYAQGIQFEEKLSWAQVQQKARKENKNIFIDVYATWCVPCAQMDAKVYPTEIAGMAVNEKFIAVKLQQDKTKNDNDYVKSWYKDAEDILQQYPVEGLPSFLFIAPNGKLLHRGIGYQHPAAFAKMVAVALTDPIQMLNDELLDFHLGKRDYTKMPELISKVKEIKKDEALALQIAKEYKATYLDKLPLKELLSKKHLDFIGTYYTLINTKDKFFTLCYTQPDAVNKVKQWKRTDISWAKFQVEQAVNREELEPRLWKDIRKGEPLTTSPNWNTLASVIKKKYRKLDAEKLIFDNQLFFYATINDWKEFARIRNKQIKRYPPKEGNNLNADAWGLNVHAWTIFENSQDRETLESALAWSDLAIKLDAEAAQIAGEGLNLQIYDTKANILYKLGRIEEAIEWEQKAIEIGISRAKKDGREKGYFFDEYTDIIKKMRLGQPTWPDKKE